MRYRDRRKEIGKALVDIGKYSFTAGIIGSIVTEKWTPAVIALCAVISIIAFIIGFYTIPQNKEDKL